jgi:hypothetical protein
MIQDSLPIFRVYVLNDDPDSQNAVELLKPYALSNQIILLEIKIPEIAKKDIMKNHNITQFPHICILNKDKTIKKIIGNLQDLANVDMSSLLSNP